MSDHAKNKVFAYFAAATGILIFVYSLFVDFVPTRLGAYADRRLLLCVLLFVFTLVLVILIAIELPKRRIFLRLGWFLPLSFCFLVTGWWFNTPADYSAEPLFYTLYFLTFGLYGNYLVNTEGLAKQLSFFVTLFTVACFFYGAMTLNVYLFAITDDFPRLDQIIPWGFVSIRYWSHLATWFLPLLPLAVIVGPFKDNRMWRAGVALAAALWWWMVFLSSSRGSMVGLALGVLTACLLFGKAALPWAKVVVKYLVLGLLAWLILSIVIPSLVFEDIQMRGVKGDSSGRWPLWVEAWQMSLQNFPFGMGSQSWLTHNILTDEYLNSKKFGHPHNMYLMWAAEYGWISIAGLGLLVAHAFRQLWARRKDINTGHCEHPVVLVAFTASVVAALVHAGVSAVFIAPASMLVGLMILSIFWALIQPRSSLTKSDSVSYKPSWVGRGIGAALVIVFAIGGGFWLKEVWRYHQAMADDLPYYEEHINLGHLPRFWFHGYFPRHPDLMPNSTALDSP